MADLVVGKMLTVKNIIIITYCLFGEKYQLNANIDGYSLPGGGTICVTPDRLTNELFIFELTVPLETNILNAHARKA